MWGFHPIGCFDEEDVGQPAKSKTHQKMEENLHAEPYYPDGPPDP